MYSAPISGLVLDTCGTQNNTHPVLKQQHPRSTEAWGLQQQRLAYDACQDHMLSLKGTGPDFPRTPHPESFPPAQPATQETSKHLSTRLNNGTDRLINQDELLRLITAPGASDEEITQHFSFWRPVTNTTARKSSVLKMSERQLDIMYAIAGCADVAFLVSNVKPQVRQMLLDLYDIDKTSFSIWFKNRGHNPCKGNTNRASKGGKRNAGNDGATTTLGVPQQSLNDRPKKQQPIGIHGPLLAQQAEPMGAVVFQQQLQDLVVDPLPLLLLQQQRRQQERQEQQRLQQELLRRQQEQLEQQRRQQEQLEQLEQLEMLERQQLQQEQRQLEQEQQRRRQLLERQRLLQQEQGAMSQLPMPHLQQQQQQQQQGLFLSLQQRQGLMLHDQLPEPQMPRSLHAAPPPLILQPPMPPMSHPQQQQFSHSPTSIHPQSPGLLLQHHQAASQTNISSQTHVTRAGVPEQQPIYPSEASARVMGSTFGDQLGQLGWSNLNLSQQQAPQSHAARSSFAAPAAVPGSSLMQTLLRGCSPESPGGHDGIHASGPSSRYPTDSGAEPSSSTASGQQPLDVAAYVSTARPSTSSSLYSDYLAEWSQMGPQVASLRKCGSHSVSGSGAAGAGGSGPPPPNAELIPDASLQAEHILPSVLDGVFTGSTDLSLMEAKAAQFEQRQQQEQEQQQQQVLVSAFTGSTDLSLMEAKAAEFEQRQQQQGQLEGPSCLSQLSEKLEHMSLGLGSLTDVMGRAPSMAPMTDVSGQYSIMGPQPSSLLGAPSGLRSMPSMFQHM